MGACILLRWKAVCSLIICPAYVLVCSGARPWCRWGRLWWLGADACCSPACIYSVTVTQVAPGDGRVPESTKELAQSREQRCLSRDTAPDLAGDDLMKGLGAFCCSINLVNAILSSVFLIDLLACKQVCWTAAFPEHPCPASDVSRPQDYTGNYCWEAKKVPRILACPVQH